MNNIVFLEQTSNYPYSFSASNTKVEFIAKGLIEEGNIITIFNSFFLGSKKNKDVQKGITDFGLEYYSFPRVSIFNFIHNIKSIVNLLKAKKIVNGKNIAFVGMNYFPMMLLSIIIAKLLGYKVVTLFHEWHVSFKHKNLLNLFNDIFSDYVGCFFVNGIFPISHFLDNKCRKFFKPTMILPILADFDIPRKSHYKGNENFTFCGHASYLLRYKLLLNSFKIVLTKGYKCTLTLITFGYDWQIEELRKEIEKLKMNDNIILKSQLSSDDLNILYDESLALLIPLEPYTDRDKARFSQKIAEYTASGRPIITTSVGEIPFYFKSDVNAVICDYNETSFSNSMIKLLKNKEEASIIGERGKFTGRDFFDYRKNCSNLNNFIQDYL